MSRVGANAPGVAALAPAEQRQVDSAPRTAEATTPRAGRMMAAVVNSPLSADLAVRETVRPDAFRQAADAALRR